MMHLVPLILSLYVELGQCFLRSTLLNLLWLKFKRWLVSQRVCKVCFRWCAWLLLAGGLALLGLSPALSAFVYEPIRFGWKAHIIFSGYCCTDGTRLADFDGDGRLDIVTSMEEPGGVAILFKSDNDWQPTVIGTAGEITRPEDALPTDIDEDGFTDLLVSQENRSQRHTVCFNPGEREKSRLPAKWVCEIVPVTHHHKSWIVAENITLADGHRMFVVGGKESDKGPGSLGLLTPGNIPQDLSRWSYRELVADPIRVMTIIVKDVNGDGRDDIVYEDRKGQAAGVSWLEQPSSPDAVWELHRMSYGATEAMYALWHGNHVFSLERHRSWEIVGYDLGSREATFRLPLPAGQCQPRSFAIADLNNDHNTDFVVMCSKVRFKRIRGYIISVESPFTWKLSAIALPPTSWLGSTKYDVVHTVDMDGDGDLDLLTDEETSGGIGQGVIWYENPGNMD